LYGNFSQRLVNPIRISIFAPVIKKNQYDDEIPVPFSYVTALWLCVADASACTNIIVGKKASVDGSVMVSYSIDGNLYIPLYHSPGRKLFFGNNLNG